MQRAHPSRNRPQAGLLSRAFWRGARLVGSLEVAVCLLPALAVALFLGALVESWYERSVSQELVYGAWWFALLLTFLGLNILFAAVKKWPWKRHQIGFLITHVGLITLVVGGLVSSLTGLSGVMALIDSADSRAALLGPNSASEALDNQALVLRVARIDRGADSFFEAPFAPGPRAWKPAADAIEPDVLTRILLWLAHPAERTWKRELDASTTLEVLDFQPHARFSMLANNELSVTPVARTLGQIDARTAPAVHVRLTHAGDSHELWLPREEGHYVPVTVGGERFGLGLFSRSYELPFTLRLERAEQTTDRGSQMPATQSSTVWLTDTASGLADESYRITLNEPLVYRGYRIYQAGYELVARDPTGKPIQRSLLRVTLDPGLRLKYVGSLLVACGIACMFYMRAYKLPWPKRAA